MMDTMALRKGNFGRVILAGAVVALAGCSGGSTGSNDDATGGDGSYVPGVSSGSLSYNIEETSIPVGATSSFVVTVRGQDGDPAEGVAINCDSEDGVAIIEPISGPELTNPSGSMSGVIGCEKPGSFRTACWGTSVNRISNVFIKCTGDIPSGFTGFPNAGGGNLGGGVATPDDPAGGSGGTGVAALTLVTGVEITDVRDEGTVTIDTGFNGSCEDDKEERFGPDLVSFTVVNNSASRITCSSWSMVVQDPWPSDSTLGDYESPEFGATTVIDANGGSGTIEGFLTEATGSPTRKFLAGSDTTNTGLALSSTSAPGVRTVTFSINCSGNGTSFTKRVEKTFSFADYDYCE